jgi:hypothetical protein
MAEAEVIDWRRVAEQRWHKLCEMERLIAYAIEEKDRLREALNFYAERGHYAFDGEPDDWEAASGEPQNWLCAPTIPASQHEFSPSWMIEDGGVARAALEPPTPKNHSEPQT